MKKMLLLKSQHEKVVYKVKGGSQEIVAIVLISFNFINGNTMLSLLKLTNINIIAAISLTL